MSDLPASNGRSELIAHTSAIVASYLSHNAVSPDAVAGVINTVHGALSGIGVATPSTEPLKPAVPIRKSITPEYLVCLEDGKKMKMLRRHLRSTYNLTPEQYRARWGLSSDYPMVAPRYSESRSQLAKALGLGTSNRKNPPPAAAAKKTPARRTTSRKKATGRAATGRAAATA